MEQVILIFVRELGRVVLDFKIRDYLASLLLKLISMPKELIRNFFGQEEKKFGDLMKINPDDLPHFDLMIAGFPCQSFSVIGQRKRMCDYRGQIIYGLIKIMNGKNLPYFILENVKGLVNHEGGKTLKTILEELEKAGYKVYHRVLSSLHYGVPQMRV